MKYYKDVLPHPPFDKDSYFLYKVDKEANEVYLWDWEKHTWVYTILDTREFDNWSEEVPAAEAFVDIL